MPPAWLIALLLALSTACTDAEERATSAREAAADAIRQGDRAAALEALDDLRASSPDTPEAILEQSSLLVAAGEAPQVVWILEEALQRFPERDDLRVAYGQISLLVGDAQRARRSVDSIDPDSTQHVHALLIRSQAELRLGNLERALETLREAEQRYPDRAEARLARIATLLGERRPGQALKVLDEARDMLAAKGSSDQLVQLETTAYALAADQGELEIAITGLRSLVEAHPEAAPAWQALLKALAKAGRIGEGVTLLVDTVAAHPEAIALYPLAASIHVTTGRYDEAERMLTAFRERSNSPTAFLALGHFYLGLADEDKALAITREGIEEFPDVAMLRFQRVEMLLAFARVDEAERALGKLHYEERDQASADLLRARLDLARGSAGVAARKLTQVATQLDTAAAHYWLGRSLEEAGDWEGADRRYRLAIARDPFGPEAYIGAIRLAERRGDWHDIRAAAQLLVTRVPGRVEGWVTLCKSLANLGDGKAAEEIATRALGLFKEETELAICRAAGLRIQGRWDEALAQLKAAQERFGASAPLSAEHALTLGLAGKPQEGIRVAREALSADPSSAALQGALAQLSFQVGDAELGATATEAALRLAPEDPTPFRIRAQFFAATGRLDEAARDCTAYIAERPGDPGVHFILGVVRAKQGRLDQAIESYRRAAELDEDAFAPRNNLADLLADQGDLDGALAAAQEAYALATSNPVVMDTLGRVYLRKGLVSRSISVLEDARSIAPDLPDAQLHLAMAYAEAGRTGEARKLLTQLEGNESTSEAIRAQASDALNSLQ